MAGSQITWERSLELVSGASRVLHDTVKLNVMTGAGALDGMEDLLNTARRVFRESVAEEQNAFTREAEEAKKAKAGLPQGNLPGIPAKSTSADAKAVFKNEQEFAVKAWEEGEGGFGPTVLQPGEEIACVNTGKVSWTPADGALPSTATLSPGRKRGGRKAAVEAQEPAPAPNGASDDSEVGLDDGVAVGESQVAS